MDEEDLLPVDPLAEVTAGRRPHGERQRQRGAGRGGQRCGGLQRPGGGEAGWPRRLPGGAELGPGGGQHLAIGNAVEATVTLASAVTVTGTPEFDFDSSPKATTYESGSGHDEAGVQLRDHRERRLRRQRRHRGDKLTLRR